MSETEIKITGMTCSGCVRSVTRVLERLPGVSRVDVSLEHGNARVRYDSPRVASRCRAVAQGDRRGALRGELGTTPVRTGGDKEKSRLCVQE